MRVKHGWLFFFLAIGILAFFFYRSYQPHLTYTLAEQFDGNDYAQAYAYFTGLEKEYQVPPPFHQRILVPWIASWFNSSVINDFQVVNLIFTILSIWVTFLLWRRLGFEFKWMIFGFIWLIFHWTGMIRLNAFDPITVDVPLYFFQALFLWILLARKFKWLLVLAPLATMQKESFIGLMVILCLYAFWQNRKEQDDYFDIKIIVISTVLAIATKIGIELFFTPSYEGRGALIMLAYQAKQILFDPFKLVRWFAAISMAFGPIAWLAMRNYKKHFYFDNKRNLLALLTLVSFGFGLLAGGDTTRIIYLGFPFIMSFAINELQSSNLSPKGIALASLPLMMLPFTIPNPAYDWEAWTQWYPEFAIKRVVLIVLFYTLIASLVLVRLSQKANT